MKRLVLFSIACACAAAAFALLQPAPAAAGWCWPNCSAFGFLGQSTSSNNGCWFSSGEVCSYYGAWFNMGINKTCYPGCDWLGNTRGVLLYGFENHDRIRGYFTDKAEIVYAYPQYLGMGGSLRAQVAWYSGPASHLNAGAIG
jgi:hypothetical protein